MKSLRECLELIILIHDAVSVIIRVLVILQTVSIIVLVIIGNTVTIIIIILVVGNAVIVIIIYSVSQTILVRVNITPEGGDGAREEAEAEEEDDLVHVSVCPLIPM